MKKLACIMGAMLLTAGAFAQGTIVFNNDTTTLVNTNNGSGGSGPAVTSMNPRVVLFYSTAASAPVVPSAVNGYDFTGWTQTTPTTADTIGLTGAGRFLGGTQTADTAGGGSSPWVFVAGWASPIGTAFTTFQLALAGGAYTGITPVAWAQPTGNPGGSPPTAAQSMVLGATGFNGLVLTSVPEPATFVLAGLGAAGLLIFRRRK